MTRQFVFATAALLLSAPMALAQDDDIMISGDAAAGEGVFRPCVACHVVANEDGDLLAGRGRPNQTGPNLYAIAGRTAGTVEEFARYSDELVESGANGLVWTEEAFAAYVQDPTGYMQDELGYDGFRSAMPSRQVRSEEDALNLFAYLASLQ